MSFLSFMEKNVREFIVVYIVLLLCFLVEPNLFFSPKICTHQLKQPVSIYAKECFDGRWGTKICSHFFCRVTIESQIIVSTPVTKMFFFLLVSNFIVFTLTDKECHLPT